MARDAFPGRAYGRIIASRDRLLAFWSRTDAYWASGINRVFVYYAAWLTLQYHLAVLGFSYAGDSGVAKYLAGNPADLWQPHGLPRLLFSPPSALTLWLICWISVVSTIASIIGFGGRISTVTSALSLSFLVALSLAWSPYWSHGFNILCLVPLAFMWNGSPSLSIDELIRKYITKRPDASYPIWPSLLAQAAIALFLFAAFYAKLGFLRGTFTLNWVFSDNMRNAVTMPYAMRGYAMPWWVSELVSVPVLYVFASAAHLFMQGFPIFAIFTRSPYWRLAEGAMFFLGTALLYLVMTLGVAPWFLLCALFVDWDFWICKFWKLAPKMSPTFQSGGGSFAACYSVLFVALFTIVSATKSAWSNGFYPFSPMDFYSTVDDSVSMRERLHAMRFVHRPYFYWLGNDVTFHKDGYINDYRAIFNSNCSYVAPHADDKTKLALTLSRYNDIISHSGNYIPQKYLVSPWSPWRHFAKDAKRYTEIQTTRLELSCTISSIPAYPADPLSGRDLYRKTISVYDVPTKTIRMATGEVDSENALLRVHTYGFRHPYVSLFFTPDPTQTLSVSRMSPLPGRWVKSTVFKFRKEDEIAWYTTVRVKDVETGKVYDFWGPYIYWQGPHHK